jgi:hypothetical protein
VNHFIPAAPEQAKVPAVRADEALAVLLGKIQGKEEENV